jgi:hypothetical protein
MVQLDSAGITSGTLLEQSMDLKTWAPFRTASTNLHIKMPANGSIFFRTVRSD